MVQYTEGIERCAHVFLTSWIFFLFRERELGKDEVMQGGKETSGGSLLGPRAVKVWELES